jgi:formylglycine-generating enzyme required for sulfatase activity
VTLLAACAPAAPRAVEPPAEPPRDAGRTHARAADAAAPSEAAAPAATLDAAAVGAAECPEDMAHVRVSYCPRLERRCLKSEYDKANHITICHRFEPGSTRCLEARIALDFCIDRYEYPNQKGAHPPWMVSWYDAAGLCAARDKRLCYESEWTAACEGLDELPFPYGWERDPEKCNIDNAWVEPKLSLVYSPDQGVSEPELRRLDRSVPSGSRPGCVSGFGVFDLTGNLDEWALADRDRPKEKAVFAALKGGAWGHVRNACRPVTTSHEPEFRYYFVSFRCCADRSGGSSQSK